MKRSFWMTAAFERIAQMLVDKRVTRILHGLLEKSLRLTRIAPLKTDPAQAVKKSTTLRLSLYGFSEKLFSFFQVFSALCPGISQVIHSGSTRWIDFENSFELFFCCGKIAELVFRCSEMETHLRIFRIKGHALRKR